jgi:hypothetical protein
MSALAKKFKRPPISKDKRWGTVAFTCHSNNNGKLKREESWPRPV